MAENGHSPLLLSFNEEEVLSNSSGEGRVVAVKQSFVSDLRPSPTPIVNSDDDFRLCTVDEVFVNGTTATNKGISPSSSQSPPTTPTPTPYDDDDDGGGGGGNPNFPGTPTTPPVSPVVMVDGCPCDLDSTCQQQCCVETIQAMHRARVEKINSQPGLIRGRKGSNSSYGSMDSTGSGSKGAGGQMVSPVGSTNCDGGNNEGGVAETKVVRRSSSPDAVHCVCHKPVVDSTTRKAVMKLVAASLIALVFMVGEMLGEGLLYSVQQDPQLLECCH